MVFPNAVSVEELEDIMLQPQHEESQEAHRTNQSAQCNYCQTRTNGGRSGRRYLNDLSRKIREVKGQLKKMGTKKEMMEKENEALKKRQEMMKEKYEKEMEEYKKKTEECKEDMEEYEGKVKKMQETMRIVTAQYNLVLDIAIQHWGR